MNDQLKNVLYQIPENNWMLIQKLIWAKSQVSFIGQDVVQLFPQDKGR